MFQEWYKEVLKYFNFVCMKILLHFYKWIFDINTAIDKKLKYFLMKELLGILMEYCGIFKNLKNYDLKKIWENNEEI